MGQLEKGELTTESSWRDWDEVRKNSVLTQTLHNISQGNNKPQQNARKNNSTGNSANSDSSASESGGNNSKSSPRPCTFYNNNRCFKKADHSDSRHPNWMWLHICSYCKKVHNDTARHSEVDCPFKGREASKNGEGPAKGQ